MSDLPRISFAIPAYHRPALLAEAVASINALAGLRSAEIVVCDDGRLVRVGGAADSQPSTAAIPGDLQAALETSAVPVRYVANEPPLGAVGNWNRCLREARGEWVTVLHEDDVLYPGYFKLVAPRLREAVAAVAVRTRQGPSPGAPPPSASAATPKAWAYPPAYFLKSSPTPFPGVMLRRSAALALGGFDERWGPLADYEFWYRLACAGRVEVVREVGAFYRVAPGQWTERAWVRMLRLAHLLRLRIAREQFRQRPELGRWLARFFTYRNALSYAARFPERPAGLDRALALGRIPGHQIPAGWVWQWLKLSARPAAPAP
ncbi:MAG TPA: glycosyltransferase family A protein [Opitutaceae bacterium]|jgi:glycosyltransferase involved in cell wall biosynthesis|nr:glycosyltransferase family A protein [Opitutaceae bacterium]